MHVLNFYFPKGCAANWALPLTYHPDVRPWKNSKDELAIQPSDDQKEANKTTSEEDIEARDVLVPQVRVQLLQTVRVLPQHTRNVKVQMDGECRSGEPMLLEPDFTLEESGLQINQAILIPDVSGIAVMHLTNPTGYSCKIAEGSNLGVAEEITLVSPRTGDSASRGAAHEVLNHRVIVKQISTTTEKWRRE